MGIRFLVLTLIHFLIQFPGDLRFYEESVGELIHEIDEWNTSNDALIWVNVPELNSNTKLFAYWGNDLNTTIPTYASDGGCGISRSCLAFSSSGEDSTGFPYGNWGQWCRNLWFFINWKWSYNE